MEREKFFEAQLTRKVKKAGGLSLKFISPNWAGAPDRIVLDGKGGIAFVEVKAPGKEPRPLQLARHKQLRKLGMQVYVVDSEAAIEAFMKEFFVERGRELGV